MIWYISPTKTTALQGIQPNKVGIQKIVAQTLNDAQMVISKVQAAKKSYKIELLCKGYR